VDALVRDPRVGVLRAIKPMIAGSSVGERV
jgi:hypothetical protein